MKPETLAEGRKLANAATGGPWKLYGEQQEEYGVIQGAPSPWWPNGHPVVEGEYLFDQPYNAEFIAWFGTHRAELFDYIEKLEVVAEIAERLGFCPFCDDDIESAECYCGDRRNHQKRLRRALKALQPGAQEKGES
jgi:hypothetical protein